MASVMPSATGRETESEAAARLHAAFDRLRNPMLIVDDERRCVTKLGAHTRAHGVAIALRTGQIDTLGGTEAP